jgi:phosphoglycerate-specific signal transduction histidine kinase
MTSQRMQRCIHGIRQMVSEIERSTISSVIESTFSQVHTAANQIESICQMPNSGM